VDAYNYLQGGGILGYSVQGVYLNVVKSAHPDGTPKNQVKQAFLSQVALTPEPKNHATDARILKSLQGRTIEKTLTAGSGTDHSAFTGGRALIRENLGPLTVSQLSLLADDFRRQIQGRSLDNLGMAKCLQQYGRAQRLFPGQVTALAQYLGSTRRD
jgi:hypothetical protein